MGEHRQEFVDGNWHRLMARELSLTGRGGSSKWSKRKRAGQVQRGGDHEIEIPVCSYQGLVWDGAERGTELGGWDGVTND